MYPEKALEVLESIKAFFDIKGIVYVVGMNSESIDHIIKEKYGKDTKINGMDYLEKIVQLPFQIPVWRPEDITGSIEKIISKELEDSKHAKEFEEERRKSLIVKAIEPNPRQVKRFVNNIILANEVFGKDIDKLIVVQALHFRSEWNRFLELISADDELRKTFFREYYARSKDEIEFKEELT
jgi:KAP family P-loop domain